MKRLIVYGPDAKLETISKVWAHRGMRFELEDIEEGDKNAPSIDVP